MLVVTGYASLDHVMYLDGPIVPDQTTRATRKAWPRAGGCPTYIAKAAASAGQKAAPVMWLGDDEAGDTLVRDLKSSGVATDGLARIANQRSPVAMLSYLSSGSTTCFFDPGAVGDEALTAAQTRLVNAATHLCVSVGPAQVTASILDARTTGARLYWAVKDDPACFSPDMRAMLAAACDVVFCNQAERALVPDTQAIIVETRGSDGVAITQDGTTTHVAVAQVACRDATGAGDTLAGGYIAAEMAGAAPIEAAKAGVAAAAKLLRDREGH